MEARYEAGVSEKQPSCPGATVSGRKRLATKYLQTFGVSVGSEKGGRLSIYGLTPQTYS